METTCALAPPAECAGGLGEDDVFSDMQVSLLLSQMMMPGPSAPPPQKGDDATARRSRHFSGGSHHGAPPTESAEVRDTSSDDSMRSAGARGKLHMDREVPSLFSRGPQCCAHTGSDPATGAGPITPASSSAATSSSDVQDFTLLEQLATARAHAEGLALARDAALLDALNYGAVEEARQRSAAWFGARASTVMPPLQAVALEPHSSGVPKPAALPGSLSSLLDEARGHYERSQRARRMVECASHAATLGAAAAPAARTADSVKASAPSSSSSSTEEELTTLRALVTTLQARCTMASQDAARAAANTACIRERLELLLDAAAAATSPDDSTSNTPSAALVALRDLAAATRAQLGADSGRRLRDELRSQMAAAARALAETQRAAAAAAGREEELRAQLLQERAERRRADTAVMTSEATMDRIRRSRQAARDECERQRQQCEALRRELGRVRAATLAKADEGASPALRVVVGAPSPAMCDSLSTVSPTTTVAAAGGVAFSPSGPVASPSAVPSAALSTSDVASVGPSPVGPSTAVHPNTCSYQVVTPGASSEQQALARFAAVEGACAAPAQSPGAGTATRETRGSLPRDSAPRAEAAGRHAPRAPSACEDEVQATVVVAAPVVRRDRAVDPAKLLSTHSSTVTSLPIAAHSSPVSDVRGESPNRLSRSLTTTTSASHAGAAFARSNTSLCTGRRFDITAISHAAEPTQQQQQQQQQQQRSHADPHSPQLPRNHASPSSAPHGAQRQSFFADPALHGRRQSFAAVSLSTATATRRGMGAATSCAAVAPRLDAGTAFRRSETTPLCAVGGGGAPVYRASPLAATASAVSPFATVQMPQRRLSPAVVTRVTK